MSNKDVIILNTVDKQLREYVKYYGLKDHSPCLCGSKNTYAECCKKNEFKNYSDSDIKKWQANLLGAIRSDKYIKNPTCMYSSCNCQSIGSHSVQKNRYLNQLADKNGNVYRVLKKYRDGTYKVELKAESLNHATKFNGFCDYHDSSLFNIVESEYSNQFELEQLYAHTYRSVAYSKYKVGQWLTIIRENHFKHLPHVYSSRVASNRGTLDLQALLIHQYRVAEANYNDLSILMCEIEKNYDHKSAKWIIKNDVLDFSSPFIIPTKSLDLIFYNTSVRKYDNRLILGELDYLALKYECNDVLTTIVFPDFNRNEYTGFMAIPKLSSNRMSNFFNKCKRSNNSQLLNVLNNIIYSNTDELFLTKSFVDQFIESQDRKRLDYRLLNDINDYASNFDFDSLRQEPIIEFIKPLKPSRNTAVSRHSPCVD